MNETRSLTQPQRLGALLIDMLVVAFACRYLFGSFYPPLGNLGFWAYSALLSVLVGSKFVTPFYVKPADAIAYAVPAFVSLMLVNGWSDWAYAQRLGFVLAAAYSALIFTLGILNITLNAFKNYWADIFSRQLRSTLDIIAQPHFIYTPLILFAVFSFHSQSWNEAVVILIVTILTVVGSVGDFTVRLIKRLRARNKANGIMGRVEVFAFQDPGIVIVRQQWDGQIKRNDVLYVADKYGPQKIFVALDTVGRSEGVLVRAVELKTVSPNNYRIVGDVPLDDHAYSLKNEVVDRLFAAEGLSPDLVASIVGLVAPDTSIDRLYFEVVDGTELSVGRLVSTRVGSRKVLYQVISGLTREEIVQHKNTYGFARAQAQQIGVWDEITSKFVPCTWLPQLNAPVVLEKTGSFEFQSDAIGHFPDTNLHTRIKSTSELVTHNTAILGILGIGKSCLAFEVVERLLADGIKVICLDITDEYKDVLSDLCYDESSDPLFQALVARAGVGGKSNVKKHVEEGGNKPAVAAALEAFIDNFIHKNQDRNLLIINPTSFEVWRQDSKPYGTEASMASLSPTEVTQLFTEAALNACQKLGRVDRGIARVCLVYEEAHSLIPEWNAIVNEGDKAAVNGTARAILQGRKFGLGCLLITQRTANVTKTILNQCNTIFAMRTFDETGKDFLTNYIGKNYTESLSSLPERHAVFFGKASSCENPVLVRLNDMEIFRPAFRALHPIPAQQASPEVSTVESYGNLDSQGLKATPIEIDDDIQF